MKMTISKVQIFIVWIINGELFMTLIVLAMRLNKWWRLISSSTQLRKQWVLHRPETVFCWHQEKWKMTSPFNSTCLKESLLKVSTSYYKSNINIINDFRWVNTEGNVWKTCLHSVITQILRKFLLETGAISAVWVTAKGLESATTYFVKGHSTI